MRADIVKGGVIDRVALAFSGLCVVHCFVTALTLATLSTVGGVLGSPIIHEVGLALAIVLGIVALGNGIMNHGRLLPLSIGGIGIAIMAAALALPHGGFELLATMVGVLLLAGGHFLNRLASG